MGKPGIRHYEQDGEGIIVRVNEDPELKRQLATFRERNAAQAEQIKKLREALKTINKTACETIAAAEAEIKRMQAVARIHAVDVVRIKDPQDGPCLKHICSECGATVDKVGTGNHKPGCPTNDQREGK